MQKIFCRLALLVCLLSGATLVNSSVITTLNNSDPAPIYDSNFPFAYLYDGTRDFLNRDSSTLWEQGIEFSITPYFDKANGGWNKCGTKYPGPNPVNDTNTTGVTPVAGTTPTLPVIDRFYLGDIAGRWNILALLPYGIYDAINCTSPNQPFITYCPSVYNCGPTTNPTAPCTCAGTTCFGDCQTCTDLPSGAYAISNTLAQIAQDTLACISGITGAISTVTPPVLNTVQSLLELQGDGRETFGFLSVKTKFQKRGARFRAAGMLTKGFGLSVTTGISHLTNCAEFIDPTAPKPDPLPLYDGASASTGLYSYTVAGAINPFANSTGTSSGSSASSNTVDALTHVQWKQVVSCLHTQLMEQFNPTMAQAIGINLDDYEATSIDDIRAELYWRYMIELNKNNDSAWPDCALMPFFATSYTLGAAKGTNPDQPLSVAFGNNGHNAGDFNTGISLFFYESCEVGFEGGGTFFMKKEFDGFRVPNNIYQNIIYPYKTSVCVAPGTTWHIGAYLNSRHFDNHFSMHFQYLYVNHMEDKYTLLYKNNSPTDIHAFNVDRLEDNSAWKTQLCNIALSYDVSPGCMITVKGQMPFSGANVYKTNTISFSLEFVH